LGVKVDWNSDKGQAEISTKEVSSVDTTVISKYTPTDEEISNSNGRIRKLNGVYYVEAAYICDVLESSGKGFKGIIDEKNTLIMRNAKGESLGIVFDVINDYSVITYDYYVDNILPLIK